MQQPTKQRRQNRVLDNLPAQALGKVPVHDSELEAAILGGIMLESGALIMVEGILSEKIFYKNEHVLIYRAIKTLRDKSEKVDLLTVTAELRRQGTLKEAGGAFYVTELTSKIASAANIEFHVRLTQEMYIKRRATSIGYELIQAGFSDESDPFDIIEGIQAYCLEVLQDVDNGQTKEIKTVLKKRLEEIARLAESKQSLTGVATGFTTINNLTGGWQKPDLIVLAARPAMGKTALALKFLQGAAESGVPCAIFSLEMSDSQLVDRVISQETKVASSQDLNRGKISNSDLIALLEKTSKIYDLPIYIDDTAGLTLSQLRSKAYKLKAEHDIGFIVIDYLQLMSGDGKGNREQEISQISRGLKKMAKELQIPVLALSQLSRAVEQRGGAKVPQLSDLRESGAIEQDADIVVFLHRPEYYGITEDENGNSTAGIAQVIFAKHRNGALDTISLNFKGKFTDFTDIAALPDPHPELSNFNYGSTFRSNGAGDF